MITLRATKFGMFATFLLASASIAQAATKEAAPPPEGRAVATFAGGCFWCMEPPFDKLPGVLSTTSGYTDGRTPNPTYEQVSGGGTGHTEAVRVVYDPDRISYGKLLEVFWRNVDPLDGEGQFCDRGDQYRPGIYTHDDEQRRLAEASKAALKGRFEKPLAVEIKPATAFYIAEDRHQDYYQNHGLKYRFYRYSCGRDARLQEVWGD